jgi:hypothetical protein
MESVMAIKVNLHHVAPGAFALVVRDDAGTELSALASYRVEYKSGREPWTLVGGSEPLSFSKLIALKAKALQIAESV